MATNDIRYTVRAGIHGPTDHLRELLEEPVEEDESDEPDELIMPPMPSERAAPRSIDEIVRARRGETEKPVETAPGFVLAPWMLISGIAALVVFVFLMAVSIGQSGPTHSTPNPADSNAPLADRYPSGPRPTDWPTPNAAPNATRPPIGLAIDFLPSGEYEISFDDAQPCIPAWSSPPPAWTGDQDKIRGLLTQELNGCLKKEAQVVLGWYGETNWVMFARPNGLGVDRVWSDITWFGYTLDDVKALPEAKSGAVKDYKPSPPPAPTSKPVYVPPVLAPAPIVYPTVTPIPPTPTEKPLPPVIRPEIYIDPTEEPTGGSRPVQKSPAPNSSALQTAAAIINGNQTPTQEAIKR